MSNRPGAGCLRTMACLVMALFFVIGTHPAGAEPEPSNSPSPTLLSPPTSTTNPTPSTGGKWHPTDNPHATVVPGQMRSDREEVPGGFSKADADKAETMEARSRLARLTPGCQVYWPAPFEVCGAIKDKYNELGGPNSFLLWPKTNELTNPDGYGKRSEFLGGHIYWSVPTGAHPVAHDFLAKWGNYGYEAGYLGYPLTDEIINPDNIGRRQQFQGGYIYWSPLTGAHTVGGGIFDKWGQLGWESGAMGYPVSDEINTTPEFAAVGQRMNFFVGGALIWNAATNIVEVANRDDFAWVN